MLISRTGGEPLPVIAHRSRPFPLLPSGFIVSRIKNLASKVVGITYFERLAAILRFFARALLTLFALREISKRRALDKTAARASPPFVCMDCSAAMLICGNYTMLASSGSV